MNEKDWNYTDSLPEHQRLYIKSQVRVMIDDEAVWLPAEMLEGAYVLDDDSADEYNTLIRIPKCGNARGYVDNDDIVFFTQTNPEKLYLHRLEVGNAFRYQDSSSTDNEVEDAPEWLNNICNRIDALEAQVEMLEPDNFRNLVMSLIESPAFAHMVYNTVRQQSIRYQASQKTLKDLWEANTPLYYRDKGWR